MVGQIASLECFTVPTSYDLSLPQVCSHIPQMADPLSILIATSNVAATAVKVLRFIIKTKTRAEDVDEDFGNLMTEIESLGKTSEIVHHAFEKDMRDGNTAQNSPTAIVWSAASKALVDCNAALAGINDVLGRMKSDDGLSTSDQVERYIRRLLKDEEFVLHRERLESGHRGVQTSLDALGMSVVRFF
jgi:hypothetical protein